MAAPVERRVLIAVDGSENSERAFNWYRDHFHKPEDEVILYHCYEQPTLSVIDLKSPGSFPSDQWQKLITERMKEVNDLEANCTQTARTAHIKHTFKAESLDSRKPGEKIVHAAHENKVTHILMGSRGLGKLRRTFLGSVSDYVLHHAGIPVTIVPPKSD